MSGYNLKGKLYSNADRNTISNMEKERPIGLLDSGF